MFALIWRLLIFITALWFVQRALGFLFGAPKRQPRARQTSSDTPDTNKMVRDPICGMYLDPRLAISMKGKKDTLYFCSQECRQKYTTG
jgi:uncharacterized protein